MSGCIIQMSLPKLALVNPLTNSEMEMVRCGIDEEGWTVILEEKTVLGPQKRLNKKILNHQVSCNVTQAYFLNLIYVRILKASSRQAEAWAKAVRLHLFIDRSSLNMNRVLDAPLGSLTAGADKKYPSTPFNFIDMCNFRALEWNEAAKKSEGDPLGFFLANGTRLEAELHSNKALRGTVTVEVGYSSVVSYKAPLR